MSVNRNPINDQRPGFISKPREPSNQAWKPLAAWGGVTFLLVLAGIGIVFTIKQRANPSNEEGVRGQGSGVSEEQPAIEKPKVNPPRPAIKVVAPKVVVSGPEVLAVLPREVMEKADTPMLVIEPKERVRPEGTEEPKGKTVPDAKLDPQRPKADVAVTEPPKMLPGRFGTKIDFLPTSAAVFEAVREDNTKLAMIMHIAGSFEGRVFTSENVEKFRRDCLLDPAVAELIQEQFVCACLPICGQKQVEGRKTGGNVVVYFCLNDSTVIHAIPGPVSATEFLKQARWIINAHKAGVPLNRDQMQKAHRDEFFKVAKPSIEMPPRLPTNEPVQTQVHWLLARETLKLAD
ncbi:MAG: hypothetical protein K8T89_02420, partial [Planctomycetes bacterium]|nr:hypothetical protein [Planctomycetota bacterium]